MQKKDDKLGNKTVYKKKTQRKKERERKIEIDSQVVFCRQTCMWNNKQTNKHWNWYKFNVTNSDMKKKKISQRHALWRMLSFFHCLTFSVFVWTEPKLYTNCRTFRRGNARCEYGYWQDITIWFMSLFPTLTNKPRIMSLNWVSSRSLSNFKSFFPSMFSSASFDVTILTLIFPTRKKKDVTIAFLTPVIRRD